MKQTMIAITFALLLLSACTTGEINAEPAKEEIVIGFIGPLVGDNAVLGESARTGVELAISETDLPIKVIYENGGCNAKDAVTAVNKLINVDKVKVIIGGLCSSEALGIAPITEQNKIVSISAAGSSPDITKAGDYVFRTWPSDQLQGPIMADYVLKQGHKKVAVIHANSDYTLGLANAFMDAFKAKGGEIVIAESYDQDVKDFRTSLTKIKGKNPDALYIVTYMEGGLLVKQARELGITQPVFSGEAAGSKDFTKESNGATEGLIYATPKFDESSTTTANFITKYRAKFGKDSPYAVISSNGYDCANLIISAIKEKGYSADGIRDFLYNVKDYDGAGGKLTIDQNGDAIKSFQIMKISGDEFVKVN